MLTKAEIDERLELPFDHLDAPSRREREALQTAWQLVEWHQILHFDRQPLKDHEALGWMIAAAQVAAWLEGCDERPD